MDFHIFAGLRFDNMSDLRNYILNKDTLKYERKKHSWRPAFRYLAAAAAGAVLFFGYLFVYMKGLGLELPKTAMLKKRNAEWASKVELMNSRMDRYEAVLQGLETRDNRIYRSVFGMNEIAPEVRNAGFGGVNRYAHFDGLGYGSRLRRTAVRLDKLTKKACVQSKSFDDVEAMARKTGDMASCIPAIIPVNPAATNFHVSSTFGFRKDPITGNSKMHTGQDIACKDGNKVYATGDGVVESVKYEFFGYGRSVLIDHGFGYKTRYAHMSRIDVVEGMKVKRGSCIGLSGHSGRATGSHVHYEVIYKGKYVNPNGYIDYDMTAEDYSGLVQQASDADNT